MSLPHPVCSSLLVSSRFESHLVGGEPVCYIHLILHDVEKKNVS